MDWASIQPLFGGVIGGVFVALLNILYTRHQEKHKQRKEGMSLLTLVSYEIELNDGSLKRLNDAFLKQEDSWSPQVEVLLEGSLPISETWDTSKVGLAQSDYAEVVPSLVDYYSQVHRLRSLVLRPGFRDYKEEVKVQILKTSLSNLFKAGEKARLNIDRHLQCSEVVPERM